MIEKIDNDKNAQESVLCTCCDGEMQSDDVIGGCPGESASAVSIFPGVVQVLCPVCAMLVGASKETFEAAGLRAIICRRPADEEAN